MFESLFRHLPAPDYPSYLPLYFREFPIGWVHFAHLDYLERFPKIFILTKKGIHFSERFTIDAFEERSKQIAEFSQSLQHAGLINNWRDEAYGVYEPNADLNKDKVLFTIERGVAPILGLRVYGIHINGYQVAENQIQALWIARRSKLKVIEPHKLDNLAAGGLSFGEDPLITAKREAAEEANISLALTENLQFMGTFNYLTDFNKTFRNECIYMFNLPLPASFQPEINDGEVEAFYKMTPLAVEDALKNDEFKPNSGIVTLSFLLKNRLTSFDQEERHRLISMIDSLADQ